MRHALLTVPFVLALTAAAAHADGKVYVPLPNMAIEAEDSEGAEKFLGEIYTALVLASNCTTTTLSAEEHSLLTDSFDLLAYGEMAMTTDHIISAFEQPAFAYLDNQPNACDEADERKLTVLNRLESLGGSLAPIPDQEQAYEDWRSMMDAIRP